MTMTTSTLRPGYLVSLKTSVRGNVRYFRNELPPKEGAEPAADGVAIDRWETERTITDPVEHEAAKKARQKAQACVRKICQQSAFGLLCPEVDAEKLDNAVLEARAVVDAFNDTASLSHISFLVLRGKVSPDDVEAVRAINSEIRDLMAEMASGIERGNVDEIREAASRVKGIGDMLTAEAQAKVEVGVKIARSAATQIKRDLDARGASEVDRSAMKRIDELRMAFLDLDDSTEVSAPKAGKQVALDLAAE